MSSIDRSAMKQHQLAKLPDLALQMIFEFFEYDDLLNLKNLCDDLAGPITSFVQSKTLVINYKKGNYRQSAFSNDYLLGKSPTRFRANDDMHLAIKKLVLYNPLVLFNLTTFDNLTHLTIQSTTEFNRLNRMTISLKNLEEFEASFESNNFKIVLEAPKLWRIWCNIDLSRLKIIDPRSIQTLTCIRISETVKQMVNLKTLSVTKFSISDAGSLLSDLYQLKKFYFYVREDPIDATEEHLQSALLANPNLRIFWNQIDFNANPLKDADQHHDLAEDFDGRLDDQSVPGYQQDIDDEVVKFEIRSFESLSVELIRKITFLDGLKVLGAITDTEKWVELLKLPALKKLTINSAVEEHHLDLIPKHCPSMTSLKIDSFKAGDWVLRLKCLVKFKTGVLFDFGLFKKMVQQLYYLKVVRASELYEIEIEDGVVGCYEDGWHVLNKPKAVFLQTIESVNSWSALFNFKNELV